MIMTIRNLKPNQKTGKNRINFGVPKIKNKKKLKNKNGGFLRVLKCFKNFLKFFLKLRLTFPNFERILSGLSS